MQLEQRHGTGLRWRGPEPRTNRGVEAKPNPVIAMTDVLCPGLGKASSGTAGSGCGGSEPRAVRRGGGSSLEGALLPGQWAPTRLHHVTAFHCLHGAAGDPLVSWRWRDDCLSPNDAWCAHGSGPREGSVSPPPWLAPGTGSPATGHHCPGGDMGTGLLSASPHPSGPSLRAAGGDGWC